MIEHEFKEDDIDFDAFALYICEKQEIPGWSHSATTKFDHKTEHLYRNSDLGVDIRIDVVGQDFKVYRINQPWNRTPPELIEEGSISDLSIHSIERFINSSLQHGLDSKPDHEVGDLQEYLRSMWQLLTPQQKLDFVRTESVQSTLTAAEGEEPKLLRESSR